MCVWLKHTCYSVLIYFVLHGLQCLLVHHECHPRLLWGEVTVILKQWINLSAFWLVLKKGNEKKKKERIPISQGVYLEQKKKTVCICVVERTPYCPPWKKRQSRGSTFKTVKDLNNTNIKSLIPKRGNPVLIIFLLDKYSILTLRMTWSHSHCSHCSRGAVITVSVLGAEWKVSIKWLVSPYPQENLLFVSPNWKHHKDLQLYRVSTEVTLRLRAFTGLFSSVLLFLLLCLDLNIKIK